MVGIFGGDKELIADITASSMSLENGEKKYTGTIATSASTPEDPFLVKFSHSFECENPKDWPMLKKWTVTGVLSVTGFNRIMVSTIMAPALSTIALELHMNSTEAVMAMSVYLLATAFGPLVIGPLSEVYGRTPVLHATSIWFLIWNFVCGFSYNKGTLIAARLLAGFGASAIYALGGGVLGDVWRPEQRGQSLGLYMLIPLLAVAVGPLLGGFITEGTTWRWMFWSTSILQAFMIIASIPFFSETHAPTILRQEARRLRKATGDRRYYTEAERLDVGRSVSWILMRSLSRPMRLLLFHPIIQIQACLSAFAYGLLYLVLSTFSDLYIKQYHESISTSGLHYIAICLGEVVAAQVGGPLMDFVFDKMKQRSNGTPSPEFRIPIMIPGSLLTPIGLFLYGWAAQKNAHWIVVDFGAALLCFGMQISGQAMQAYIIDTYPDHTSSASAASQFLRSLTAFGFPLFAPKTYAALGYGWGNSLLAFLAIVIGIPAPLLVWLYGPRLRAKTLSSY
ncbi:Asparasone A synthesis mfs2 [Hyphodiscus hymeniophilus]|uniref:Asparasone A synthesis mfs2 n=1 Tax=Hyphodiscus hymeniophilus TaxID=353542 RepID=A0A9P6VQV1_9HELO|nr:Asparasone A synthesis mfs2 [Hyphodiscus hymeniophilus]